MSARITIEQMQAVAKEHGGVCLSTEFVNALAKLRWRCAEGHEWEATSDRVKRLNFWCPTCKRTKAKRDKLEECHALARAHDGECLSTAYVNSQTKLRWRCAEGHEWKATPANVKHQNFLCRTCKRTKAKRDKLEECHALAKARGGVCLSTEFVNALTKLWWRCAEGHEWEARPAILKSDDTWCPTRTFPASFSLRSQRDCWLSRTA